MKPIFLLSLGAAIACTHMVSADPAWWSTYGIYQGGQPGNDWSLVTAGQLKYVATQAKAYLDAERDLTAADWDTAYGGPNKSPLDDFVNSENYAVVNVGQLKFIASGFYTILAQKFWEYDVRSGLIANGMPGSEIGYSMPIMPWNAYSLKAENAAPITIGQLKLVFSFDLSLAPVSDPDLIGQDDADGGSGAGDFFSAMVEYLNQSGGAYVQNSSASSATWTVNQALQQAIGDTAWKVVVLLPDRGIHGVESVEQNLIKIQ